MKCENVKMWNSTKSPSSREKSEHTKRRSRHKADMHRLIMQLLYQISIILSLVPQVYFRNSSKVRRYFETSNKVTYIQRRIRFRCDETACAIIVRDSLQEFVDKSDRFFVYTTQGVITLFFFHPQNLLVKTSKKPIFVKNNRSFSKSGEWEIFQNTLDICCSICLVCCSLKFFVFLYFKLGNTNHCHQTIFHGLFWVLG